MRRSFDICCGRCSSNYTIVNELGFKCFECGFFVSIEKMIEETKSIKEDRQ